jgi:tyrosine-protein kinase Etk/Wzc
VQQQIISSISQNKTGVRLKDYISVIIRRRWVILISLLSICASTFYYVYTIEDIYESFSVLVIEEEQTSFNQLLEQRSGRPLSFYQGILNSRTFMEMVMDSIGRERLDSLFPKFTESQVENELQSNIVLKPTNYSSFLRLSVRAKTADLAYDLARYGTRVFRKRSKDVENDESRRAVEEIDKQLEIIREKLENAEAEYRSFIDKSGNILEGTTQELSTLQEAYASNLAQLGIKEADLAAEKKLLASLEKKVTPQSQNRSPEYLKLRSRLRELEKEKIKLENLGIRLSGFSTIDRDISTIEQKLLQYQSPASGGTIDTRLIQQWQGLRKSVIAKESELELFKRKLEMYKKAIANYKEQNPDILSESLELLRLKRSKETLENVYNLLLEKSEEVKITSASSGAGIKIVDNAERPAKPIPKNERRYYLLGFILGLALGIGLALLIEFNDTTIKSNEDIERYLQLSVLGTIPHIVTKNKEDIKIKRATGSGKAGISVRQYPKHLLNFEGDDSVISESYRSLRTNLSFVNPDSPLHAILLTSAGPGEGKSLTISNLAMAYAQMGKKTLLVDTDLRRPVIHHLFKQKREPGFADLFIDEPDFDTIIKPSGKANLSIITAGMFTPNPAELIGSLKMEQLIKYFRSHFDMIFFDTPPLVAVTDATLLASKLDGLLIVIKSHHTDREVVGRALGSLRQVGVKVIGSVLNDIDLSHRYSSYGYYKYYYHYYKSKAD